MGLRRARYLDRGDRVVLDPGGQPYTIMQIEWDSRPVRVIARCRPDAPTGEEDPRTGCVTAEWGPDFEVEVP